jgi:hypothetical protein
MGSGAILDVVKTKKILLPIKELEPWITSPLHSHYANWKYNQTDVMIVNMKQSPLSNHE